MSITPWESISSLAKERSEPLGASEDSDHKLALHIKVKNNPSEPSPVFDPTAFLPPYDAGSVAYPDTITEVYTFTFAAATVATLTLIYTDATKTRLSSWARS